MTLELTTTEAIVVELKKRYPLLMVLGSVENSGVSSTDVLFYQGNVLALIGLATVVKHDLTTSYLNNLEPTDDTP